MSTAGVFVYGVVVFAIVAAACGLIAYGIVTERRDRRAPEAEQADAAAGAGASPRGGHSRSPRQLAWAGP